MAGRSTSRTTLTVGGAPPTERHPFAEGALPPNAHVRGLYVHVPFCFHKCHYCDFYSLVDRESRQPAYVARLLREIAASAFALERSIETIFIGGGTPTLLEPPHLRDALNGIRAGVTLAEGYEWTVEANPETVTPEVAEILVAGGVNRVSLGAQSFDERALKTLERWHDPANVRRAVETLRAAGIRRINLDLIFGVPGTTLDGWERDLDRALALEPDHLSCYGLTYEPNTAMTKRLDLGEFEPCDEDLEADMYERTIDRLAACGFEQYEISNWAKPGERCRHNMLYWTNADWWALGPSASGHIAGTRFKLVPRISEWLGADGLAPVVDLERPDVERAKAETLLVGLRLLDGLPRATVDACLDVAGREALARHLAQGTIEIASGRVRLTRRGLLVADGVLAEM
jgi:oxygen-independent coproporphyrinogen-3 oxidase